MYSSLDGLRIPVPVLSVPVIPLGSGTLWGEDVPVGCESPAVPVCAGPWLGPGLMGRYLYSETNIFRVIDVFNCAH